MIRRSFRIGVVLGLIGGLAFALVKIFGPRPHDDVELRAPAAAPWPPLTEEPTTPVPVAEEATAAPKKKAPAKRKAPAKAWVEPTGSVCPTSHPVKAKLSSKIFHLPGMLNYERTNPDRCYVDAKKAEADGLRPAKR